MSRDIDNLIAKAKLEARAEQIMQDFELVNVNTDIDESLLIEMRNDQIKSLDKELAKLIADKLEAKND